jgi:hypothetical protein
MNFLGSRFRENDEPASVQSLLSLAVLVKPSTMPQKPLIRIFVLAVCGLLAACSTPSQRQGAPAPVVRGDTGERSPAGDTARPAAGEPSLAAYVPPARPETARPQPARAVEVLLARAEDQRRSGDLGGAAGSLERALRIEPNNPEPWSRLAAVRAEQGRFAMAEEFAAKSNSLAALADRALKRRNWEIIAAARRAQGRSEAAREAERRASSFD